MAKVIILSLIVLLAGLSVYAAEDKTGQDNFISNAISDAFTKVNQYMSGEKEIVSDDAKGMGYDMENYNTPAPGQMTRKPPVKNQI